MADEAKTTAADDFQGFPLTIRDLERLKRLAESSEEGRIGMLASADYHRQGRVHVPSRWLLKILGRVSTDGMPSGGEDE